MYSLILCGGLGNQMFQYAFVRALQLEYGIDFQYNTTVYDNRINADRQFALDVMNITRPYKVQVEKEGQEIFDIYNNIMNKVKKIKRLNIIPTNIIWNYLNKKHLYCSVKGPYKYHTSRIYGQDGIILGSFQSFKYFSKYADIISKELKVIKKPNSINSRMLTQIQGENAVCVHIRRGDYLNGQNNNLVICDYNYYLNAMNYIIQKEEQPIFFVFSNTHEDIVWIKENYKLPGNIVYVDLSNPDYEELRLMYTCKHFIISNSTFSWWAQFLAENKDKRVVAPSIWDKSKGIDYKDIYMEGWYLIDV